MAVSDNVRRLLGEFLGSPEKANDILNRLQGDNTYNPNWNDPRALSDWRMMIGPFARENWTSFPSEVREGLRKDAEDHIMKMTSYLALASVKKSDYDAMAKEHGVSSSNTVIL
jgi:hypothetical protein